MIAHASSQENFWQIVRSEKLQNESFPNFSIFCPEFCPESCSEFSPNFLRSFRASFCGRRRPEKIHQKSPPFFNAKFPGRFEEKIHKMFLESGQSNKLFLGCSCALFQRGSRESGEPPKRAKQRRIGPFSRDSRKSRECRDFRDSRDSSSEKTSLVITPFSVPDFLIYSKTLGEFSREKSPSPFRISFFSQKISSGINSAIETVCTLNVRRSLGTLAGCPWNVWRDKLGLHRQGQICRDRTPAGSARAQSKR